MTGTIHVEVIDSAYNVKINVRHVSLHDKMECLDAIANGLEMDDSDMDVFFMMRKLYLLKRSRRPMTEEADSTDEG